jgi:hypothetical protein
MPTTYEPIATTTLSGSTSEVTFTSIPATFTDLRLVFAGVSSAQALCIQFNGDTSTNYSLTVLRGDGTSAVSSRNTSIDRLIVCSLTGTNPNLLTTDVFSYAGSTYKTLLSSSSEDNNGSGNTRQSVGLWRSTSAITSLRLYGFSASNITGTATLYGIKAA